MFSIGDFASHGRVSVRMLRHYDAIGLLRPAAVDRATGYRSYEARQLSRLNRILSAGYNRALYIECGQDRDAWVTELQEPVATS
jgi:DNA-binding transcriptional MerR regulator